jgi:tetraacyldisaccharide 4'-kinase
MEIARRYPCVIVSRGYRGKLSSVGAEVDLRTPAGFIQYGDEPWMMAKELSCPVWIGKNRVELIQRLEGKTEHKLVVLDDGFQHFSLNRDLDLVVLSADKDPKDAFCLPLGDLREPLSSLAKASALIVISGKKSRWKEAWLTFLKGYFSQVPVYCFERVTAGLWEDQPISEVPGRLLGFCGIGSPQGFKDQLADYPGSIFLKAFSDHVRYTEQDVAWLLQQKKTGADFFVTTDKDWVKVASFFRHRNERILRLRIRYEIPNEFWYFLDAFLGNLE